MNSDQAVAMDMPPCGVLAVVTGGFGDQFQLDGESRPQERLRAVTRANCTKAHGGPSILCANFSGGCPEIEHQREAGGCTLRKRPARLRDVTWVPAKAGRCSKKLRGPRVSRGLSTERAAPGLRPNLPHPLGRGLLHGLAVGRGNQTLALHL